MFGEAVELTKVFPLTNKVPPKEDIILALHRRL